MAGRPKRPLLDCPECGDATMPASVFVRKGEDWDTPRGWVWNDGDEHDCKCGAKLVVEADGELAQLVERGEEV